MYYNLVSSVANVAAYSSSKNKRSLSKFVHRGALGLRELSHRRRRNILGKEGANSLFFILNPVLGFGIIGLPRKQLLRERHVMAKIVTFWYQLFVPVPTHLSINLLVYFFPFFSPLKCFSLPLDSRLEDFAGGEAGSRWFCAACQVLHNFPLPHNPLVKV